MYVDIITAQDDSRELVVHPALFPARTTLKVFVEWTKYFSNKQICMRLVPACVRPSVHLPRVLDADRKLGLTMVRANLQSAPEPLDVPEPVGRRMIRHRLVNPKHVRKICVIFLRSCEMRIGRPLVHVPGNVHAHLLNLFLFWTKKTVRDTQTDRPTDRQIHAHNVAYSTAI